MTKTITTLFDVKAQMQGCPFQITPDNKKVDVFWSSHSFLQTYRRDIEGNLLNKNYIRELNSERVKYKKSSLSFTFLSSFTLWQGRTLKRKIQCVCSQFGNLITRFLAFSHWSHTDVKFDIILRLSSRKKLKCETYIIHVTFRSAVA